MNSDEFEKDLQMVVRDKYEGDASLVTEEDRARLAAGEPLAYIIGWVPFLGLKIYLDTHPLIPRPETEWWTELLIIHLRERFDSRPFTLFDLCAGSGAIGLAVLVAFPNARVYFGELIPEHCALIQKNIEANGLDQTRAAIIQSDLFDALPAGTHFDIIATNPPYIPDTRTLELSVTDFEPTEALYAGADGLTILSRIAHQAIKHITPGGEVWVECDITNAEAAGELFGRTGASRTELRNDLYDRPRLVVAYF
ncbi:MAG: modification methylase, HemK family [Parcubacteria group bacterium]|nr:modification methylase, HemK family [Parcubacteria group bacterium]